MNGQVLIELKDVKKYFPITGGLLKRTVGHVKAVDGVSFTICQGETLGLVGESGCGKSTLGRCILRLIEPTGGQILYRGENLLSLDPAQMRAQREKLQIIFQDPYASLNPKMTVGDIVSEPLTIHRKGTKEAVRERTRELLRLVGLQEAAMARYPHEFSGGQRQRIGIARALALNPELVVCDEPVSALDVSVRSQVLNLMSTLRREMGLTFLFISHDLSVVKHISDRVAVMYLGQLVEIAGRDQLYRNPRHPYTRALLSAIPIPDPEAQRERIILEGDVPIPAYPPAGFRFSPRCAYSSVRCLSLQPALMELGSGHLAACHLCENSESEEVHG